MIKRLKTNILYGNIASAYYLQFANYSIGLLTIPIAIRLLKPEEFGFLSLSISISSSLLAFINWDAYTHKVALGARLILRNSALRCFQKSVLSSQFTALTAVTLASLVTLFVFSQAQLNIVNTTIAIKVVFSSLLITTASVFNPTWLFLVKDNLLKFSLYSIAPKLVTLMAIIIILPAFPYSQAFGVISLASSLVVYPFLKNDAIDKTSINKVFSISPSISSKSQNIHQSILFLKRVHHNFTRCYRHNVMGPVVLISTLSPLISALALINIIGAKFFGLYSILEKIRSMGITLSQPLIQAGMPAICNIATNSAKMRKAKLYMSLLIVSTLLVSFSIFVGINPILNLFIANNTTITSQLLKPALIGIATIPCVNIYIGLIYFFCIPFYKPQALVLQALPPLLVPLIVLCTIHSSSNNPLVIASLSTLLAESAVLVITFLFLMKTRLAFQYKMTN